MRSATKLPTRTDRPADPPETRQRVGGSGVRKVKVAGGKDPPPSVMSKAAGLPAAGLPTVQIRAPAREPPSGRATGPGRAAPLPTMRIDK
jgi:hypothetical protein